MAGKMKKFFAILDGLTGLGFMAWIYMPIAAGPLNQVGLEPIRAYQLPFYLLKEAGAGPTAP